MDASAMGSGREAPAPLSGPGSVAIVIVNWNGRDLLERCLTRVLAQDYDAPWEVVLVDNLSSDGSVEFVERRFPQVRVLLAEQNNYAAANNLGAASSRSEYVICLNTDTQVEDGWLQSLVECVRSQPRVGAASSLVLFPDGRVNSAGIEPLEGFHWTDRGFECADPAAFEAGEIYGASGCSVLYRRSCWEEAGGLDEDFHMYYEDVDMSLRLRRAGWKIVLCPASRVRHEYNASIRKREARAGAERGWALKDQLGERNRLFVIARHYPGVLAEYLPLSRFLLEQDGDVVHAGLELILRKWEIGAGGAEVREQLRRMLLVLRGEILGLASWARSGEFEVQERERKVREIHRALKKASVEYEAERRSWRGRVRRLEGLLTRRLGAHQRAESEALDLRSRVIQQRLRHEAQHQRDRGELEDARRAYGREIQHREEVIARLKQLLAERDEQLRKRSGGRD